MVDRCPALHDFEKRRFVLDTTSVAGQQTALRTMMTWTELEWSMLSAA